jgi:hypothetical protein
MVDWNALLANAEAKLDALKEDAVYLKADGTSRSIRVEVDDYPPAPVHGSEGPYAPKKVVRVANSASGGIAADELERSGRDRIQLRETAGSSATVTLAAFLPPPEQGPWADGGRLTLWLL